MLPALFIGFGALLVACSLMVILHRNPVTSALFLVLAFCSLAGIYLLLHAEFVAMVQIIVYAGAIMVLFLFVVMLLNAPHEDTDEDLARGVRRGGGWGVKAVGVLLALAFALELVWALGRGGWAAGELGGGAAGSVAAIGRLLFTDYAFPFEVTSVLILVAMVGSVLMARRRSAGETV